MFNRGAELLLGYSADEVVGKQTPALFHLDSETIARGLKLSQEYGVPVEGFRVFVHNPELHGREQLQWTYVCKDGRHVQVSLIITVIRSAEGNITGYLGIAHDISKEIKSHPSTHPSTQSVLLCRVKLASVSNRIFTSPFEKGGLRGIYLKNLP